MNKGNRSRTNVSIQGRDCGTAINRGNGSRTNSRGTPGMSCGGGGSIIVVENNWSSPAVRIPRKKGGTTINYGNRSRANLMKTPETILRRPRAIAVETPGTNPRDLQSLRLGQETPGEAQWGGGGKATGNSNRSRAKVSN